MRNNHVRGQMLFAQAMGRDIHPILLLAGYGLAGQVAALIEAAAALVPIEAAP